MVNYYWSESCGLNLPDLHKEKHTSLCARATVESRVYLLSVCDHKC